MCKKSATNWSNEGLLSVRLRLCHGDPLLFLAIPMAMVGHYSSCLFANSSNPYDTSAQMVLNAFLRTQLWERAATNSHARRYQSRSWPYLASCRVWESDGFQNVGPAAGIMDPANDPFIKLSYWFRPRGTMREMADEHQQLLIPHLIATVRMTYRVPGQSLPFRGKGGAPWPN